jgi:hypothetical protein
MTCLIGEAEAADRYRKRLGRTHPLWGNGSLEGAGRSRPLAPPRSLSDTDFLACMALALAALVAHRRGEDPTILRATPRAA